MLKCWNVGTELFICDTTKSPPIYTLPQCLSMSDNNCGIYWLDSCNLLTSHSSLKSSKQFTVSAFPFLLGDNFHSQILKKKRRGVAYQKKMSAWGAYYVSCQKKDFLKKIWLCELNFKRWLWPVLAKQPINVQFCDILGLLNHLSNVTRD